MIRARYIKHTPYRWVHDEDAAVVASTSKRLSLPKIAAELGVSRDQAKRRVKALGVGVGKDLRPGILDTLRKLLHPMRPVTRAMLTREAPGHRVSLHRVITRMLQTGELAGTAKDIRLPDQDHETGAANHDETRSDRAVRHCQPGAAQCVR